jgi:hypothetical protein
MRDETVALLSTWAWKTKDKTGNPGGNALTGLRSGMGCNAIAVAAVWG